MLLDNPSIGNAIKEKAELLIGSEVLSIKYEGCVYVDKKLQVHMAGEIIDTLDTPRKVNKLFKELYENEFGY